MMNAYMPLALDSGAQQIEKPKARMEESAERCEGKNLRKHLEHDIAVMQRRFRKAQLEQLERSRLEVSVKGCLLHELGTQHAPALVIVQVQEM